MAFADGCACANRNRLLAQDVILGPSLTCRTADLFSGSSRAFHRQPDRRFTGLAPQSSIGRPGVEKDRLAAFEAGETSEIRD